MKVKTPARKKASSDQELELLLRRASEYVKMGRPRLLLRPALGRKRPASAA